MSAFRGSDPSDWPESSITPDVAASVDSLADVCRERAAAFWKRAGIPKSMKEMVERCGDFAAAMCGEFGNGDAMKQANELNARVLAAVIDSGKDALLQAKVLDFSMGLNVQGEVTEQDIGRQHGLSRAAVSKRCVLTCQEFGIPPSRGMRTKKACRRYGMRQQGKRTVVNKRTWAFAGVVHNLLKTA